MFQAVMISLIVMSGIVVLVGIICWTMLRYDQKVGNRKPNPAVQAARDNLEMSRLGAQRDAIEFERDKIIDARHSGEELPPGLAEKIVEEPQAKPVKGVIQDKKKHNIW